MRLGLDREVYQIILKLEEEGSESGRKPRLTVGSVYVQIKAAKAERDQNIINRQIAKAWGFANNEKSEKSAGTDSTITPAATPATTPGAPPPEAIGRAPSMDTPGTTGDRQANGEPRPKKRKSGPKEVDRSPPSNVSILDIAGVDDTLDRLLGRGTSATCSDEAIRLAPCLVFFDEIDSIAGRRESANKGMESRIVAEIMNGMDRIKQQTPLGKNVVVLAATNRPDFLDPAIRRRFSSEIDMGMPNEKAREHILRSLTRDLSLADDVDFRELAKLTPGYVGSDLQYVVKAAVSGSCRGKLEDLLRKARALGAPDYLTAASQKQRDWVLLEDHRRAPWEESHITMGQFKSAVSRVQPASKREGFSTIPDTTWAHVGALDDVRKKLEMSIIGPIKNPELFTRVGIKPAAGILLWGPPGCGKTLVAKAVANESKANFISIKGPELLNKYVGESERAVRQLFARAKSSAPCILFFDEMDALVPRRDDSLSDASARVVNTLLTELDGVGDRSGIYVIGATNRPDIIDEAIRRPGRLGTSIYVGLPSAPDRVAILRTLFRNTVSKARAERRQLEAATAAGTDVDMTDLPTTTTTPEADLERVALDIRCTGFSGADLGNLMQAAAQACLERAYLMQRTGGGGGAAGAAADPVITAADWERALRETKPSVKDAGRYTLEG
ncbi:hypothetical protein CHGG_07892 [Chaetomium globosum CBS 148.51]|uniref:Peroxisomal ATPase PEX1 n=1 Tax=Chaetomium globosum (strain ATCC 6205 / CBS 148.51 / DSM 1962 / NBRC 6347 / NRRL 1970) TaxID=306901 RepID=Q2GVW2_CHAGB|nr:uncharacterized protein CHGG_07892 [Chaetomium globosum CBS 148.51]EAQ86639.1 hypothetical protein CHGG_07892 [Chaetomium globosum CBS 148.51]